MFLEPKVGFNLLTWPVRLTPHTRVKMSAWYIEDQLGQVVRSSTDLKFEALVTRVRSTWRCER